MRIHHVKHDNVEQELDVKYTAESEAGGEEVHDVTYEDAPHPDLVQAMQTMRPYWKKAIEALLGIEAWSPGVDVHKVKVKWHDESGTATGVIVHAKTRPPDPASIKTPHTVPINDEVREDLWALLEEVIAYVQENKRQPSLFDQPGENGETTTTETED